MNKTVVELEQQAEEEEDEGVEAFVSKACEPMSTITSNQLFGRQLTGKSPSDFKKQSTSKLNVISKTIGEGSGVELGNGSRNYFKNL